MKNSKRLTAILTTAILVSLMTMSLAFTGAYTYVTNPQAGTVTNNAPYSEARASAQAWAAMYGNLLQYEWGDPLANTGERNGFNPGPAPDRPDVLYVTSAFNNISKVILGKTVLSEDVVGGVHYPYVASMSSSVAGWDGQIFGYGTIRVNATNSTTRTALLSLNPTTGACNWASILGIAFNTTYYIGATGAGNGTGHLSGSAGVGADMGGASQIYKIDDKHIATISGGLSMFDTSGNFYWRDEKITPGAVYHVAVVAAAPVYKVFGPRGPGNTNMDTNTSRVSWLGGWDLSDPEKDLNVYNSTTYLPSRTVDKVQISSGRSMWNYTIDEPGSSPMMCYGDGKIFMGSYSSFTVYAVNATDGTKIWESAQRSHTGYAGTYAEGNLFVGCEGMYVTCINGTTGETVWRNTGGLANRAFNVWNVNYAFGRVYLHDLGAGRSGAQKCLDAKTGKLLWAATELELIGYYQTVVSGDGKIFGMQSDGSTTTGRENDPIRFSCWDAFTGQTLWSIRMNIACPTLVYGNLYFVGNGGGELTSSQLWCISTAQKPEDWSMWRGNVANPGYTYDRGPLDISQGPKWTFTTGAGIISSPVVANGKLYIGSNDKNIYCLDAYNGSLIWKTYLGIDQMTTWGSTVAVVGDKVIVGPDNGYAYCLDANTGIAQWQYKMMGSDGYVPGDVSLGQWKGRSSPIIYKDRIYVGSFHDNTTYCLDLDGKLIWSVPTGGPIVSSAAIENNIVYMCTWGRSGLPAGAPGTSWNDANNCYVLDADTGVKKSVLFLNAGKLGVINFTGNFSIRTSFPRVEGGGFGASFTMSPSYTPVVVGTTLYIGTTTGNMVAYNVTDGQILWAAEQPFILGENSCGSPTYVPDSNRGGMIICQAGPTIAAINASLVGQNDTRTSSALFNQTTWVPFNSTQRSGQQTGRLSTTNASDMSGNTYTNLWSSWGGWMVWGSPTVSNFGYNASKVVYVGSESWGMFVINASNGVALSWFTNDGPISSSPAVYDGKLYYGSGDNKIRCFEDHLVQPMAISMSLDKTTVDLNKTESVTISMVLSAVSETSELMDGTPITHNPPFPNASVIVTFTSPSGVDTNKTATTDNNGMATVTFTPNEKGTWKAIAWFTGADLATYSYGYAFSDQVPIEATQTITSPPVTNPPAPIPVEYYYAAIAVIVIVIVAVAALMLLRRRKK